MQSEQRQRLSPNRRYYFTPRIRDADGKVHRKRMCRNQPKHKNGCLYKSDQFHCTNLGLHLCCLCSRCITHLTITTMHSLPLSRQPSPSPVPCVKPRRSFFICCHLLLPGERCLNSSRHAVYCLYASLFCTYRSMAAIRSPS